MANSSALVVVPPVVVPALDHDAMMLARFGHTVNANGRLERRIVAALCAHMGAAGWTPCGVYDGDDRTAVTDTRSAMELLFNLDDAHLFFRKGGNEHWVRLVFGNGTDLVSDWSYSKGDRDGFNASIDSFDSEVYV